MLLLNDSIANAIYRHGDIDCMVEKFRFWSYSSIHLRHLENF